MPSELPPIWVVSLDRATDRRDFVERVFGEAGLPFEIVPAVDGRALSADDLRSYSSTRAMYEYGRELGRGMLACSLSHLRVLERMIDDRIPEVVVFEDDTRPVDGFSDILRARGELPSDMDVVTFHSLFEWATPHPISNDLLAGRYRVCQYERTPMGTQAYLVTRRAAQRVLDVAYPVGLPPDELLFRPRPAGLTVYGIEPAPVVHEDFPSEVRAPAPPVASHGPSARAALQAVRLAGGVRRRLEHRRRQRGRATLSSTSSQRTATTESS